MSFNFLSLLNICDDILWNFLGVPAILCAGIYLSYKSGWMQIKQFKKVTSLFFSYFQEKHHDTTRGVHPLKAFFAAVGGCIGIANIAAVCTAVKIGGPGAIFWMWTAALLGMIVKYSEIYIGITHRIKNKKNSYDGGPMYYLKHVPCPSWTPLFVAVLLCIYGVDMYIFRIITHSAVEGWGINHHVMVILLLAATILGGEKGIERIGTISSAIVPLFLLLFMGASGVVFIQHWSMLPSIFYSIFSSAFTGHAATGAFAGSGILLAMTQGMKRACYSGDIGIGYASIIHSESDEPNPSKQASLGIFAIFIDTFVVCTISVLLILVTGLWTQNIHEDIIVARALESAVPFIHKIWPAFIFLLGYSSLLAVFVSGKKAAKYISKDYGITFYTAYAVGTFLLFSYVGNEEQLITGMSLIGGLLLVINLWGMINLSNKISFKLPQDK